MSSVALHCGQKSFIDPLLISTPLGRCPLVPLGPGTSPSRNAGTLSPYPLAMSRTYSFRVGRGQFKRIWPARVSNRTLCMILLLWVRWTTVWVLALKFLHPGKSLSPHKLGWLVALHRKIPKFSPSGKYSELLLSQNNKGVAWKFFKNVSFENLKENLWCRK